MGFWYISYRKPRIESVQSTYMQSLSRTLTAHVYVSMQVDDWSDPTPKSGHEYFKRCLCLMSHQQLYTKVIWVVRKRPRL